MSGLAIDTIAAARGHTWTDWGDQLNRAQLELREHTARLQLTSQSGWAVARLAGACDELWSVAGFVRLVAEQAQAADSGSVVQFAGPTITELLWRSEGRLTSPAACAAGWNSSGVDGELGATFAGELCSPYAIDAGDPVEAGRQLVIRALRDTDGREQLRKDEFGLVQFAADRYLVVLPGVIDLSHFHVGLDSASRTVRDVDHEAFRSARSTAVADNGYAQLVWQALIERGVAVGSELVLVGHSFGADTALDLAADPAFNGPGAFRVTHAVAAAYDSEPQLDAVPASTDVLVLRNAGDVVVIAEAVGHAHLLDAVDAGAGVVEGALNADPARAAVGGLGGLFWHSAAAGLTGAAHVAHRLDDVGRDVIGLDLDDVVGDVIEPAAGTTLIGESHVVAVFHGGNVGLGHHQDNYIDFLAGTSDPLVTAFLAGVAAGSTAIGTAVAVDVSVPDDDRGGQGRVARLKKPES